MHGIGVLRNSLSDETPEVSEPTHSRVETATVDIHEMTKVQEVL